MTDETQDEEHEDGAPESWWDRPLFDPKMGQILGRDYAELLERSVSTWGDLIWRSLRVALVAVVAVFVMAFVPRSGWWLLVGGLSPLLGVVVSFLVGHSRFSTTIVDDGHDSVELTDGQVVVRMDKSTEDEFEVRTDAIAALLSLLLFYLFPALIYTSVLVLSGAWLGIAYGASVINAGTAMVLGFMAIGTALAVAATFVVRVVLECILFIPVLIAYWMLGGK